MVLWHLSTSPITGVGTPRHLRTITLALLMSVPAVWKVSLMSLGNFTLKGLRLPRRRGQCRCATPGGALRPTATLSGRTPGPTSHARGALLALSGGASPKVGAPTGCLHSSHRRIPLGSRFRLLPSPQSFASWDSSSTAATPSARNRPKAHPHQSLSENHQGYPPVGLPPTPLSVEQRPIKAF